jgi:hypothetical protein
MSNVIFKRFYTHQIIDGDLIIYTWDFNEDWGLELAYHNRATNQITYVDAHPDPDKFCEINDVFLSRVAAVADAEGLENITIQVEIPEDDIIDDEGLAFFAKIRDEHLDEEEFDKDSGAFETDKDEEKE